MTAPELANSRRPYGNCAVESCQPMRSAFAGAFATQQMIGELLKCTKDMVGWD